jgi:hypothetical protein
MHEEDICGKPGGKKDLGKNACDPKMGGEGRVTTAALTCG